MGTSPLPKGALGEGLGVRRNVGDVGVAAVASAGMMIRLGHLAAQTAASLLVEEELPEDRGRRIGGRGRALLLLLAALLLPLRRLLIAGGLGSGLGSGFGSCRDLGSLGSVAPGCVSSIPVSNEKSTREVLQGDANFGVEVDAVEILAPRVVGIGAAEDGDVDEEVLQVCVIKTFFVSTSKESRKRCAASIPLSCQKREAVLVVHPLDRSGQDEDLEDVVVSFEKKCDGLGGLVICRHTHGNDITIHDSDKSLEGRLVDMPHVLPPRNGRVDAGGCGHPHPSNDRLKPILGEIESDTGINGAVIFV
jgi:hypothetical protein